ncbi:MAG: DUF4058 family protein [Bacteroidota bacterium]
MKSPFPGMDPFLESIEWRDFHNSLAYVIKRHLVPYLSPKYFARIERYLVKDTEPGAEIGLMYPDVEIARRPPGRVEEAAVAYKTSKPPLTPPTFIVPDLTARMLSIPYVEIKDKAGNQLITAIEILSPVNKNSGMEAYQEKRRVIHAQGAHLLEIDLLRRGKRQLKDPAATQAHYLVSLLRAHENASEIWAISVRDTLPVVPVPLKHPDPDVPLDLQKVFEEVYGDSAYDDSISYSQTPPPPAFSKEDKQWMQQLLQKS